MVFKKTKLFLIIILITFLNINIIGANNYEDGYYEDDYYEDDYGEDDFYEDDYPPVNLELWPDLHYIMDVESSIIEKGAIHRQYYKKHQVRLETITEETIYYLMYKFEEDYVNEIVLLDEEKEYIINEVGYGNFLEMNDSFETLLYPTLPGEELAVPGCKKIDEVEYLGRKVEEWLYVDNSGGESININLLVDRELRQILKITFNEDIVYNVKKIEFRDLPENLFNPPAEYETYNK